MPQSTMAGGIARIIRWTGGALVVVAILAGGMTGRAMAAELQVKTADFPPLTIADPQAARKGLLYDLVMELLKLQNLPQKIEFADWSQVQKQAAEQPDVITFPMTRTAKRESQYKWLVKLFDMDRAFASLPGRAPFNTAEEAAKAKAIGVLLNSASLGFLKEKGLNNIVELPANPELIQALKEGRIDAIYQPKPFSTSGWKAAGGQGALVFGTPIERSAAYIVASPTSPIKAEDWRDTFQVLEQEGTFDKLVEAYGMKE